MLDIVKNVFSKTKHNKKIIISLKIIKTLILKYKNIYIQNAQNRKNRRLFSDFRGSNIYLFEFSFCDKTVFLIN